MVWRNMRNFFYAQSPAEDDPVRMVDVWVESLILKVLGSYTRNVAVVLTILG